jgi:AcrR family transcriptional regulator
MARRKDEDKRQTILGEAKKRFAQAGYESTSMTELASLAGIPVGSLYTYFESKETILETIIEEGWGEFLDGLLRGVAQAETSATTDSAKQLAKLSFLVKIALPGLFRDLDLIAILLTRAGRDSGLEEKLDFLTDYIVGIIGAYNASKGRLESFDRVYFKTALAVFLLGSLEVMRLIYHGGVDIEARDVLAFLISSVEGALGSSLPEVADQTPKGGSWPEART